MKLSTSPLFVWPAVVLSALIFIVIPCVHPAILDDGGAAARIFFMAAGVLLLSGYLLFVSNSSWWKSFNPLNTRWFFWWTLLLVWAGVTVCYSSLLSEGISSWLRLAIGWALLPLMVLLIKLNQDRLHWLSRFSAFSCVLQLSYFLISIQEISDGNSWISTLLSLDYRHGGLAGNKNFLSEVLFFQLLLLAPGFRDECINWRRLIIGVFSGTFVVLLLLKTISVWLALMVVILGAITFVVKKTKKGRLVLGIGLLILFSAGIYAFRSTTILQQRWKQIEVQLKRPLNIAIADSLNNNSVFERRLMWRNSLKLISENPVLGVGLSDWKMEQARFGMGGTNHLNSGMVRFEHPHNEYLLLLAEQGIPGILLFLLFCYVVIISRRVNSSGSYFRLQSSRLALAGFLVIAVFAYPVHNELSWTLVMVHLAIVFSQTHQEDRSIGLWSYRKFLITTLLVSGSAVVVFAYRWNGEAHRARSMVYQLRKQHDRSRREALAARNPWHIVDPTGTPLNWYIADAYFRERDIPGSLSYFEKAVTENPYHLRVLNDYATACEQFGKLDKAVQLYEKALNYCPLFIEVQFNLAAAYHNGGKSFEAVNVLYGLQPEETMTKGYRQKFNNYAPVILRAYVATDTTFLEKFDKNNALLQLLSSDSSLVANFRKAKDPEIYLQNIREGLLR